MVRKKTYLASRKSREKSNVSGSNKSVSGIGTQRERYMTWEYPGNRRKYNADEKLHLTEEATTPECYRNS